MTTCQPILQRLGHEAQHLPGPTSQWRVKHSAAHMLSCQLVMPLQLHMALHVCMQLAYMAVSPWHLTMAATAHVV